MGFIITKDVLEKVNYALDDPKAVIGPRSVTTETEAKLRNGEGQRFRLLDDDGILYYEGLFIDDSEAEGWEDDAEFQPLDAYGRPNAGAVTIKYLENGQWVAL